ncbi:MAG: lipopolysaccharide heptosyltransferase family protein [Rhodospirillaceae bacterium]|nr:lipopolysaccharide heptosyltransferase family protein [Rhodospirillales bacterium]
MSKHLGPTAFTRFRSTAPFSLKLSVCEEKFRQQPDGSKDYFTRNKVLRQQLSAAGGAARVMMEGVRFETLPVEQWGRDFGRQRVMFVLPSDALGDCVGVVLFLRAFRSRFPDVRVTVANTGGATDIFGREAGITVLPLVISAKELARHFPIIDLGEVDGWDAVVTQPVDVEAVLLNRFQLDPVAVPVRPVGPSPRIGILPMASSPLRTLPPMVTAALADALKAKGQISVVLNAYQGCKIAYEKLLRANLPEGVQIIDGFATTHKLLDFMDGLDFVAACDSGPAHLTKLFGTAGTAIYTSAAGDVLQGRHRNLGLWQVPYGGDFCTAPCGLAKVRATADGEVGCMGSLKRPLAELPRLPNEALPGVVEKLMTTDFIPCAAELVRRKDEVAAFAVDRFDRAAAAS